MSARRVLPLSLCITVAACMTPPPGDPVASPAPAAAPAPQAPSATVALEERHHQRAQDYVRARNWADALVQWELLALLSPESTRYRDALAETRAKIRESADNLSALAEQSRRQGNLDQATLLYLRVLNVDRGNQAAAQALRDIDAERTRRAYINRPPRGNM